MLYSSVWTRVPGATAASMIGWIVTCCTLASMRRITCPPRWIRPRMGGLSFSRVPRPGAPDSLRPRPSRPFGHFSRLALVPGYHVNLVDLHLAFQLCCWGSGHEAAAQLLRHGLSVGRAQLQLQGDLPVREVQAHEVEAQHPHPQRLMMPGQRRAGEVVKAPGARLAVIALPMRLRVVAPVADHPSTATPGTAHALGPAMLAHQCEALGVIQQPREVDQIRCRHDHQGSLREGSSRLTAPIIRSEVPRDGYPLPCPSTPRKPTRATRVGRASPNSAIRSRARCRSPRSTRLCACESTGPAEP